MSKIRNFNAPDIDLAELAEALSNWFKGQNYNVHVQELPGHDEDIVEANRGGWRNVLGMASGLTVHLRTVPPDLIVEIGEGHWADKAAAGVGGFILWPLAITAGIGTVKQGVLPGRVFDFVESHIREHRSHSKPGHP